MAKLTKQSKEHAKKLSNNLSSGFSVCFKYKLANGYSFSDMNTHHLKVWQAFLNTTAQMTFEQVERRYRRKSDITDLFDGEQIIHYGISETFRIHGIIEKGQFVVLRLDPSHKFHS